MDIYDQESNEQGSEEEGDEEDDYEQIDQTINKMEDANNNRNTPIQQQQQQQLLNTDEAPESERGPSNILPLNDNNENSEKPKSRQRGGEQQTQTSARIVKPSYEILALDTNTQRRFLDDINLVESIEFSEEELRSKVFNASHTIHKLQDDLLYVYFFKKILHFKYTGFFLTMSQNYFFLLFSTKYGRAKSSG